MNILFLDYDGVVNTPMWTEDGKRCTYNFPEDDKVNNFQAVRWVSEFCIKFDYSIVVSSSWRLVDNYEACLRNGGLSPEVEIVGKTDDLSLADIDADIPDDCFRIRTMEIRKYLKEHPEIENFIILDDEDVYFPDHFIECLQNCGFNLREYAQAETLHELQNNKRLAGAE